MKTQNCTYSKVPFTLLAPAPARTASLLSERPVKFILSGHMANADKAWQHEHDSKTKTTVIMHVAANKFSHCIKICIRLSATALIAFLVHSV
jgi:hypothetical protein